MAPCMTLARPLAYVLAVLAAVPGVSAMTLVVNQSELLSAGSLMRRERQFESLNFVVTNPAEDKRSYSSIWSSSAIGTGFARSMLDSAQAWCARVNNKDQWVVLDLGTKKTINGTYFQARNDAQGSGHQIVTDVHFEYSKDCVDYTPLESNRIFKTGVVQRSSDKFLVSWLQPRVAKCVKVWVDGWLGHIAMRVGLATREVEDVDIEKFEYIVQNPSEASRTYSSVFNSAVANNVCARSMLDSTGAWCANTNDQNQWMIIQLSARYMVNGVYFQSRSKASGGGDQLVKSVRFEYSQTCASTDYQKVGDGTVFNTTLLPNEENKRLVTWDPVRLVKCVKIFVVSWENHISMRVGLSGFPEP